MLSCERILDRKRMHDVRGRVLLHRRREADSVCREYLLSCGEFRASSLSGTPHLQQWGDKRVRHGLDRGYVF
jgi:hypothetical protein